MWNNAAATGNSIAPATRASSKAESEDRGRRIIRAPQQSRLQIPEDVSLECTTKTPPALHPRSTGSRGRLNRRFVADQPVTTPTTIANGGRKRRLGQASIALSRPLCPFVPRLEHLARRADGTWVLSWRKAELARAAKAPCRASGTPVGTARMMPGVIRTSTRNNPR